MVTAIQLEGMMTGELDLGMARPPVSGLAWFRGRCCTSS
jgi:hypothetical protein